MATEDEKKKPSSEIMFVRDLEYNLPDKDGFFGEFGGSFVPDEFKKVLDKLDVEFEKAIRDESFLKEVYRVLRDYSGRPTPLYYADRLSKHYGKGKIYLKREDLNHTGAHKINNVIGQALLAKRLGAKKVIAETGAGQHGVATATAATLLGMECEIFMGEKDCIRQHLNVERMKLLGAKVHSVDKGTRTLCDACDAAIDYWLRHSEEVFYILGSVVGPNPYPKMVRFFQSVIGREAKQQCLEKEGRLPNYVLACIGGGSNAIGAFYAFMDDKDVKLIGLEAGGEGLNTTKNAASLTLGKKTIMHGKRQYVVCDEEGNPRQSYSISAGLDYPGCGPEHCHLKDIGRAQYYAVTDDEAVQAFSRLSRLEGIIPAIESAHAIAYLETLMPKTNPDEIIIVNVSGRGDKDTERLLHLMV
ncbi:tryptophan synthase subunit beta [Cystoisospora suis]|uniref:tryptophan synthase n=1 Tax=Cystoisospora suis TaxID=483139 RepID=A0A2C6KEL2_9APIC|nr:tryptophan synthase subunit beta [Cystoisospora suis]